MTTTDSYRQPTEVLDLYDALPPNPPAPAPREEDDPVTAMIKGAGRNLAVLIGLFVVFVGLFVLLAGLVVAGWSARMTRSLLAYAGTELPRTVYPVSGPGVL